MSVDRARGAGLGEIDAYRATSARAHFHAQRSRVERQRERGGGFRREPGPGNVERARESDVHAREEKRITHRGLGPQGELEPALAAHLGCGEPQRCLRHVSRGRSPRIDRDSEVLRETHVARTQHEPAPAVHAAGTALHAAGGAPLPRERRGLEIAARQGVRSGVAGERDAREQREGENGERAGAREWRGTLHAVHGGHGEEECCTVRGLRSRRDSPLPHPLVRLGSRGARVSSLLPDPARVPGKRPLRREGSRSRRAPRERRATSTVARRAGGAACREEATVRLPTTAKSSMLWIDRALDRARELVPAAVSTAARLFMMRWSARPLRQPRADPSPDPARSVPSSARGRPLEWLCEYGPMAWARPV